LIKNNHKLFNLKIYKVKDIDMNIDTFVNQYKVCKGKEHNITSMAGGCYYIPNDKIDEFYHYLQEAVFDQRPIHFTEKHCAFGPLLVDIDFKYKIEITERVHNKEHIRKIVSLYVNEICDLFEIENTDERLTSYVFERNNIYESNGIKKDGIHIIFPHIVSYPMEQFYIRENILKKIGSILSDLPITNQIHDVVDRSIIESNNWLLFGCSKPKLEPYNLTHCFRGNMDTISLEECSSMFHNKDINPAKFFSIRDKVEEDLTPVRHEKIDILETKKKNLPKKKIIRSKNISITEDDIEEIQELVSILNNDRMESYESWVQLGWTLHNIDPSCNKLLDIWIEKSSVSSKYKDGECERIWENSRNEGFTIGTLKYWASIDNPEKYQEIKEKRIIHYIEDKNTNTNYFIATVLHRMFHDKYKYSGGEWYMFDNHIWVSQTQKEGFCLREKISTDLYKVYMKILSRSNQFYSSIEGISEEEKDEQKDKGKQILQIIHNLQTTSFKDNIMKECKELFRDDKFINKLDCKPYLLAFSNGIYDLKLGQLRKGIPDDMISMSTNIEKIDFDESDENWSSLHQFLRTIFYEKDMYDYFMTYLASCLQGHNAEEKFRIWTGCGSNGKSKILELFVYCLDTYAIKFPITLLTGKRAASNASTPEIAQSKGKRFGYLEEPGDGEKMNVGLLKEFTGGDKIKARGLFKEPVEFKPQFKLALLCNEIPSFPPYDTGTTRRMEIIEFKSKFCENPKEINEFPIDRHLSEKMKEWKELFMAYLLDVYYVKYNINGMLVPQEVIQFTQDFQKQCDIYTEFFYDIVEDTKNMNDTLLLSDLYDEFKMWYEDAFSSTKYPNKSEFKKYLKKKYTDKRISSSSKEIKGFRMKNKYSNTTNSILEDKVLEESFFGNNHNDKIIHEILNNSTNEEVIDIVIEPHEETCEETIFDSNMESDANSKTYGNGY